MRRFWVTARTSRPSRVWRRMNSSSVEEDQCQNEDGNADVADRDDVVEDPGAIKPGRSREGSSLRAEDVLGDLLQGN